jgi:hypothetical protein
MTFLFASSKTKFYGTIFSADKLRAHFFHLGLHQAALDTGFSYMILLQLTKQWSTKNISKLVTNMKALDFSKTLNIWQFKFKLTNFTLNFIDLNYFSKYSY